LRSVCGPLLICLLAGSVSSDMLGASVMLTGLKAKPELNGARGTVVADRGDSRWAVKLEQSLQTLSISGKNLVMDLPPAGPCLAQSAQKALDNVHDWPEVLEKNAHLPSFAGPAKDCRHGGPPTSDPKVGMFIPAMIGFMQEAMAAHNRAVTSAQANGSNARDAVVQMEINTLFRYWSRPEMAGIVQPDSFKVAFACAVDATLDSEFTAARQFVRTGSFLRDFAKYGGAQMFADYTNASALSEVMARYAESQKCLHETRTDRGLKIYLAKQLLGTCSCIAHDAIDALERTPKAGKCQTCRKELPVSQLKQCSRCGRVEYCGRECQKSDWKTHKILCRQLSRQSPRRSCVGCWRGP
jgi:hypothetical protein